ncbi:MAG: pyridoxal phosphate-dependent aminotransferase [Hyphomicrobiales bacterium]|nr:pyridoxal phosphate-dependent aminotransferase [Hyphomicrobiales bacterium]
MKSSLEDPTWRLRPEALAAPKSGIVEVFDAGRGRQGLIPLWVGEGDASTPDFICEAITRSLAQGETFYTYQCGLPELRQAIAAYMTRAYGTPYADHEGRFEPERFFVTIGGMHALQAATRLVAGLGDEVIVPTPAWPNFVGAFTVAGARVREVPMQVAGTGQTMKWSLDLEAMAAAIGPATRVIVINSPSNPTGWVASLDELQAVLDLARRHDLWIIADEIYGRLYYDGPRAPSFHDIIHADDKVMFIQTMSKNWAMTGLRIGWLEAPAALGPLVANLIQYSTSGVPVPIQRAAVTALEEGDKFLLAQARRCASNREVLMGALTKGGGVDFAPPQGAFYLYARLNGYADTRALALRLVEEANVGVAPGTAFGPGGAAFVRMCFAPKTADVSEAARRLILWLQQQRRAG